MMESFLLTYQVGILQLCDKEFSIHGDIKRRVFMDHVLLYEPYVTGTALC